MNKSIYIFALLFTASTFFIGCNTDEPNSITVADSGTLTQTVYADQNRGENTVHFTTTAAWTSSITESRSTVTWVSITPSSGNAGTHNITLNLQPNTTGTDRSAIITITSNGATIEIRIKQQGINAPIAVTGVTLAGCNPDTPLTIGQTRQLTATVLPENATNRVVAWSSSNSNIATVNNYGFVTAVTAGTATITATTADGGKIATCVVAIVACNIDNPAGVVINGIRWATRNVDMPGTFAQHPESAGRFFQWGTLNGVVHHWAATGTVTGWNSSNNRAAWTAANDPCPQGWRVPTSVELTNLRNQPYTWTQRNGVNGRLFGIAPNQVFLPAAGHRAADNGALFEVGNWGDYWSSTPRDGGNGLFFHFYSNRSGVFTLYRAYGFSVRCVAE